MLSRPSLTLGIEEEFQVIDPETRQLRSHIQEMFTEGEIRLKDAIKREMHDSVIEVGTPICADIREAHREISRLRTGIIGLTRENGLRIGAAGTHPMTHWSDVPIVDAPRYAKIVTDLGMVARANLIFGLHVHVAIEDNETRIQIMNQTRYFLPHVLALSVNSPFWCGRDTGWKSYRSKVFERFPRTGLPGHYRSWSEFQEYINLLIATGCIDDGKKIWWDLRVHPYFPTLEFRICDVPLRVEETICIAALFQALVLKMWKLHRQNQSWRPYRRALVNENKMRACRYGLDGKMIDFGIQEEVPTESLIRELLEFLDDSCDEIGCRDEIGYVHEILKNRTGADRQLRVFEQTGRLESVVDYIIQETEHGLTIPEITPRQRIEPRPS